MTAAEADALVRGETLAERSSRPSHQVEGENFLAENAKSDGITTTESGLQYKHTMLERAFLRTPMMMSPFTTEAHCSMAKNLTPVSSEESPSPSLSMG